MEEREKEREMEQKWELEMERTRIEVQGGKFQQGRGDGGGESTESQIIKSLKLVPAFEETKVTELFQQFEMKANEFKWPRQSWVGLIAK